MAGPTIKIAKIDAARRQLQCAIELWFNEGDIVSIHTLAFAAHQIIHDLNVIKKTGADSILSGDRIKPEYRKMVLDAFKKHGNFFKHADKDPDEIAEFKSELPIAFILSALSGLQGLGLSHTYVEDAFFVWHMIHNPDWFTEDLVNLLKKQVPINGLEQIKSLSKGEFLKEFIEVRTRRRITIP